MNKNLSNVTTLDNNFNESIYNNSYDNELNARKYAKPDNDYFINLLDSFRELVLIIKILRSPNGCPWDKQQTNKTLKNFLLDEANEVVEAIDVGNMQELCEELGDLLMNILMQAQIAEENSEFTLIDVIRKINSKLIKRHPHVFNKQTSMQLSSEDVINQWQEIKKSEHKEKNLISNYMKQLLTLHSAFSAALQIQTAACNVGFDFSSIGDVLQKIKEEISELEQIFSSEKTTIFCNKNINVKNNEQPSLQLDASILNKIENEIGDLLFSIVNICRFFKISPEQALKKSNSKFVKRFCFIEEQLSKENKDFASCTLEELDEIWNKAKEQLPPY